jgi:hypothetical protein
MRAALTVVVSLLISACHAEPEKSEPASAGRARLVTSDSLKLLERADSVVLERSRCFPGCAAYRVSISRNQVVHFESRTPGDSGRSTTDTLKQQGEFRSVILAAQSIYFFNLPESIASNEQACGPRSSESPSATVTVFFAGGSRKVEDYLGCAWSPAGLRELQASIDRIANTKRWVRRSHQ